MIARRARGRLRLAGGGQRRRHRLHLPGAVADPRPQRRRQHRRSPTRRGGSGMIDRRRQRAIAEEALARAGAADIHPRALVKDLPLSRRQMVEIAKALARNPRILILDEATSALTAADVGKVFAVLKRLRAEGLALLYISHRMHEIAALADECTVYRNGRNVATYAAGTRSDAEVVEMMIGREVSGVFPPKPAAGAGGPPAGPGMPRPRAGPTACATSPSPSAPARSSGSAASTARASASSCSRSSGCCAAAPARSCIDGKPVAIRSPAQARRRKIGMALIPEDRKTEGLMLPMTRARQPLLRRARPAVARRRSSTGRRERAANERIARLLGDPDRRLRRAGRRALGRQPAEGGDRQVADARAAHHPAERPDPRHRRRHQAGALPADAPARRRGRGDPVLLHRLRRADRLLRPGAGDVRRPHPQRVRRRRASPSGRWWRARSTSGTTERRRWREGLALLAGGAARHADGARRSSS